MVRNKESMFKKDGFRTPEKIDDYVDEIYNSSSRIKIFLLLK